jgi:hypothetical protein
MKKLWIPILLISLILLIFLYVRVRPLGSDEDPKNDAPPASEKTGSPTPPAQKSEAAPYDTPQPDDPRLNRLADGRVEFVPAIEISRRIDASNTPLENIGEIENLLGQYRFAYEENPVGVENFEITEQLLGKNPKKIVFIAKDSSALKGNELVDEWGTPYFFHPQSSDNMEVISAGPDKTLWTSDDIGRISREETP